MYFPLLGYKFRTLSSAAPNRDSVSPGSLVLVEPVVSSRLNLLLLLVIVTIHGRVQVEHLAASWLPTQRQETRVRRLGGVDGPEKYHAQT